MISGPNTDISKTFDHLGDKFFKWKLCCFSWVVLEAAWRICIKIRLLHCSITVGQHSSIQQLFILPSVN